MSDETGKIGWIDITVDESVSEAVKRGATVLVPVRGLAGGRFAVIEDPAGATAALYEAG